jgi:ATP adenylyltransferase
MAPEGYNIGVNQGKVAGAGIADHIHMHIVPRWNGDTNFMPVLADVKVIPELLTATASTLRRLFAEAQAGERS